MTNTNVYSFYISLHFSNKLSINYLRNYKFEVKWIKFHAYTYTQIHRKNPFHMIVTTTWRHRDLHCCHSRVQQWVFRGVGFRGTAVKPTGVGADRRFMRSKGGLAGLLLFIPFFSCSARALALASHARMDISVALTSTYQRLPSGIVNYCPRPETFSGTFGLFEWNKRFQPTWFKWKKEKK